jgi:uncharacterized phage protein gp47/JayE
MSTFDDTGLTVDDFATVLAALIADFRASFGDNIKTGPDSIFGGLANIIAEGTSDQNELIEQVANAFNPQTASGAALSALVQLNGITRNADEFSTVTLSCTANAAGASIPAGSLVSDPATGNQFATDALLVLAPSATNTVAATAVDSGVVEATSGTLTQIDTPVYGWESVTNPADATVGQAEESDAALRIRRALVAEGSGQASVEAIFRAVSEVEGVSDTIVFENVTPATDADGVPPHSIWVVVDALAGAGVDADIAEAIFNSKCAGIGTYGTTTISVLSEYGYSYDIKFSRATETNVYIDVVLDTDDDYPSDGDTQIEDALIAYFEANQGISDEVVYSRLYTPINSVPGHSVTSLTIGFTASPVGTADLAIGKAAKAVTDATKITVTS